MFKGASLWAGLMSGAMAQLKDTYAMTSGNMNKKEYAIQTSKNLTGSIGVMAGIEYGAILGSSILPGPGTFIGALIGSMVGNWIGNYAGHYAGHIVFNNQIVIDNRLTVDERPKLT
jgi:phage tail tape-measure protein